MAWWFRLIQILWPGCIVLGAYWYKRNAIRLAGLRMVHAEKSTDSLRASSLYTKWQIVAMVFGMGSTLAALIVGIIPGSDSDKALAPWDAFSWTGLGIFYAGAILWPLSLPSDASKPLGRFEACSLALTSLGLVIWATSGTNLWFVFAGVAAAYHILVDLCWYSYRCSTSRVDSDESLLPRERDSAIDDARTIEPRLAAWHGLLTMLHYSFSFYVAAETARASNPFQPPIELTYNQWVLSDPNADSCDDTVCVVYAVSTPYGSVNIGFIAAAFSWISGTHHLIMYLGLTTPDLFPSLTAWLRLQSGLEGDRQNGNMLRAIDYGASAPLMLCCILLLFESPGNITSLAGYYSSMSLVVVAGYASEIVKGLDATAARAWALMVWASALYIILWMPIWTIMYNILHKDVERNTGIRVDFTTNTTTSCWDPPEPRTPPLTVLLVIGWLFGSFAVFPMIHTFRLVIANTLDNALRTEIWYSIASFMSKLPLLGVIAGGLIARRETAFPETGQNPQEVEQNETNRTVIIGISFGAVFSTLIALKMTYDFRHFLLPATLARVTKSSRPRDGKTTSLTAAWF